MIRHSLRLVWNRKRTNLLITMEIFFSFLVVAAFVLFQALDGDLGAAAQEREGHAAAPGERPVRGGALHGRGGGRIGARPGHGKSCRCTASPRLRGSTHPSYLPAFGMIAPLAPELAGMRGR